MREQLRTRPGFGGLIGVSERMQRVYKTIQKVSQHDYPVLVLGESGTGKELVARSVHFLGARKDRPFVPVDCSSLVPTLIESELFGYVKGAFTGALHGKQGLLEAAHGGTLFLDEIGEMPVDLQAKLLRVLQEREVKPVGSTERRKIDVRIIAATNRDLESGIKDGSFRQDLYFRLNVVQMKLPALRERKSDIPLLVTAFLDKFSDPQKPGRAISEDAMRRLIAYDWPGNVRELENAIERAVALGRGRSLPWPICRRICSIRRAKRVPEKDELLPLGRAGAAGDFADAAADKRGQIGCGADTRDWKDDALPQAEAISHGNRRFIDSRSGSIAPVHGRTTRRQLRYSLAL